MTMRVSDRLLSAPRGTAPRAIAFATSNGAARLGEVTAYLHEVYRLAPLLGIDPSIAVAQSVHETSVGVRPWSSTWWVQRLNPAGIGITGDPTDNLQSHTWPNGAFAAQSHLAHLLVYAMGPADAGSLWFRVTGQSIKAVDVRYDAYVEAYGNTAQAQTVADLAGTWATDTRYAEGIVARGNAIYPQLPDQEGPPMPDRGRPVVVLDAGHRSTDRSGNPAEMAMTDDLARAYRAELRRRGYEAYWYQEDLDRDSDPDETIGDLNTVAKGIGAWLSQQPWALFISLHYNGAHSPLHAIVPDNVGLQTAYPEGRDPNDTAANNPLDCSLGMEITGRMAAAGLGSLFTGKLGVRGLMSETETGVALEYGARLAVMAATCPSRLTAVRLVVEHGGTSDPAARRFADFARAAADAIDAVYGATTPSTTTTAPPAPRYATPHPPPLKNGKPYPHIDANGATWLILTPQRWKALETTARREYADVDAAEVGPPVKAGETITAIYSVVPDNGYVWFVSKNGSRMLAEAFVPTESA